MSGIYLPDLKAVVRMACNAINAGGDNAVVLILGTMLAEGGHETVNLFQRTGSAPTNGVAWGPGQMEPATHDSLWSNYINYRPPLKLALTKLAGNSGPVSLRLVFDLRYSAAMTRVRYLPDAAPLPTLGDDDGMAAYWKRVYNTVKGAGVADSVHASFFTLARNTVETDLGNLHTDPSGV